MENDYLYTPKGSMCNRCAYELKDCSGLDFTKMKVIEVSHDAECNIVKCDKFDRNDNG
jgi:hypothetical protein